MSKVRINDLARELEVKSRMILEYLPELGVTDKKSHSSAIEDDVAEKVRAHFRAQSGEEEEAPREAAAEPEPSPATRAAAPPTPDEAVGGELPPLTRSIAQIKADARRAVAPRPRPAPPERPAAKPPAETPAAGPAAPPVPPAARRPAPTRTTEAPAARAGAAVETPAKAPAAPPPARPARARGARRADPAANQPIYAPAASPRGVPIRPAGARRPGEPRPMHPTSTRPSARASGAAAPAQRAQRLPARMPAPPPPKPAVFEPPPITRQITISDGISIKEVSEKLEVRVKDVIKRLLDKGIFATINQTLDGQMATDLARDFGAEAEVVSFEEELMTEAQEADRPEDLVARAPVVTVMGHVDHGKTSLLDAIRETSVAAREAGGITQHIGAYRVEANGRPVVFLDTPGHEAFTMMRARGAKVTDVVVLVVAADDGVMPQTLEAINHARAAKVPIVVAVNKVDKPDAQPERVKRQLADHNLVPEEWGGDTVTVDVSAKQKKNLDTLLEMLLLVADLQGLKANPRRPAAGTVLEAKLDRGRGPVATVLVQNGTLHAGDAFIVGAIYGRVRAMLDDRGNTITEAPPATPVEVLGLEDVPQAGDRFQVIEDTTKAKQIALYRQTKMREAALAKTSRLTLDQLHEQLAAGDVKELPLIIKGDVQGSVEVLADTLTKLSTDKVKVKVIHSGVGAITEWDVLLAVASSAVIIGFSVRPERKASELAQLEKVDIRLHTIIYNVTDEIKKAMVGLLGPTIKETSLGRAEVRDTFRIPKIGTVAGCHVSDGKLTREAKVRLVRDSVVVYEGRVRSLRRFKEDVPEVKTGFECGIALENFNDIKVGDQIEAFVTEKVYEAVSA